MMGSSAFRRISEVFARLAVRQWGGGQPTDGRQDKSRSLRPGWPAADGRKNSDFARCSLLRDSSDFQKIHTTSSRSHIALWQHHDR